MAKAEAAAGATKDEEGSGMGVRTRTALGGVRQRIQRWKPPETRRAAARG
jgi:hypothetical protein